MIHGKQADIIDAFNTTSRYLDDIFTINNTYFDNMVSEIYSAELSDRSLFKCQGGGGGGG